MKRRSTHALLKLLIEALRGAPLLPLLVLGGCAAMETTGPQTAVETKPATAPAGKETEGLDTETLYDLLLAGIANQRGENETALEALTRVAYETRDPRIIARATRLALTQEDYRQASDLARLWLAEEPDNPRIRLVLAGALFELGEDDRAFRQLKLLLQPGAEDIGVYQAASDLVARHYRGGKSLAFFQRLVDLRPLDPDGWFSKALLANRLKNWPETLRSIDRALSLRPDWEEAALIKLAVLADTEQDAALKQFADRFSRDHPKAILFQLQYARVLFENRDREGALRRFRTILKRDPENADAAYAAGLISLDTGQYLQAREFLLRHLKLLPDHDQTRIFLADAEIGRKDYEAAKQWLQEVSDPELVLRAQLKLAEVIAEADGVDAALAHLRGLTAADADELAQIYSAQDALLRDAGRLQEAMAVLDEALEQLPDNTDLLYSRGLLAAQLEQIPRAEQDLRRLIELEPDNAHAYNALGYTLADLTGRYQEARELVEKALELSPDDPFILDSMGWVWYRLGDNDRALAYLRRAQGIRDDPEIAAHLGEVLWVSGKRGEAEKVFARARKLFPDNAVLKATLQRLEGTVPRPQ